MALYITFLLALIQMNPFVPPRLERGAPVEHPLNTVGSNWVVLDLETGRQGNVQSIEMLHGFNPFLSIAVESVRQWLFTPARNSFPVESQISVIFLFRPRDLFSSPRIQLSQTFKRDLDRAPLPLELWDPGYPATSIGEGASILEFQIAPAGNIEAVRIVTDVPGLAAYTERAVRFWKFQPALRNGTPVTGNVIVVAAYLRPVIYNNPPSLVGPYYPYNVPPAPPGF